MALVTCPECGREKVSDSATACPDCGYGIKEHFDKIKAREAAERNRIEEQKRVEKAKQEAEEKRRVQEQERIEQAPQRQAQLIEQLEKKIQQFKIVRIIGLIAIICFLGLWVYWLIDMSWSNTGCLVGVAFFVFYVMLSSSQIKKLEKERIKAKNEEKGKPKSIEEKRQCLVKMYHALFAAVVTHTG